MYNILLAPSSIFFNYSMATVLSAILNCKKNCNFYIMQSDWSDEQKRIFVDFVGEYPGNTVKIIDVNNDDFHVFSPWKNCYETYYKILCHRYIHEDIERILYLDVDIMVSKDLGKLYSIDFEDNYFVVGRIFNGVKYDTYAKENKNSLINASWRCAFNGGVILMNISKLKQENIDIDFYLKYTEEIGNNPYFADQGLLNYIFWRKVKYVPNYCFNYVISDVKEYENILSLSNEERKNKYSEVSFDEAGPEDINTIVHFTGRQPKSWYTYPDKDDIIGNFSPGFKNYIVEFYKMWWEIVRKLPAVIHEQIYAEAFGAVQQRQLNARLAQSNNNTSLIKDHAVDHFMGSKAFVSWLNDCARSKTKVAVLKSGDNIGQFLLAVLESYNVEITIAVTLPDFSKLDDRQLELFSQADLIINADDSIGDVNKKSLREGVILQAINIKELIDSLHRKYDVERLELLKKLLSKENINPAAIADTVHGIVDIDLYLDALQVLSKKYLVAASTRDTPGTRWTDSEMKKIHDLGFTKFSKQTWKMYTGVLLKSEVLCDISGKQPEIPAEYENAQLNIKVSSNAFRRLNKSDIIINGINCSVNMRGINFVVYDVDNNALIDSVVFDCHGKESRFVRKTHFYDDSGKLVIKCPTDRTVLSEEGSLKEDEKKQLLAECSEKIQRLEAQIDSLKDEKNHFIEQIMRISEDKDLLNKKLLSFSQEKDSLNNKLFSLSQEKDLLNNKLFSLSQEKDSLNKKLFSLSQEKNLISENMISLLQEKNALDIRILESEAKNKKLEKENSSARANYNKALTELNEARSINARAEETISVLNDMIMQMENSRSWRITKPLRAAKSFFRSMIGKK